MTFRTALVAATALALGVTGASVGGLARADAPTSPALSAPASATAPPVGQAPQPGAFVPLDIPQRVLDTRSEGTTADGLFEGEGERPAGSSQELQVAGRVEVPSGADAAVLNVTAVALGRGFVTVYPCDEERPNASNLNHAAGQTIAVAVIARLAAEGTVCLYTHADTHLVVDVMGHLPADGFDGLPAPRRLLDTRADHETFDGDFAEHGRRDAGSFLELAVAGRAGLPDVADQVVLTVTVVDPEQRGFVTVYPCGGARPTASNLNYAAGQVIANTVVSRVGDGGRVCLYTHRTTDLVVDVAGSLPASTYMSIDTPQRILDTRAGEPTADAQFAGDGLRPARATLELDVAGRVGVPSGAGAVVLNVTAVDSRDQGFVTVHPAGTERPNASNLNFAETQTIANTVITRLGADGAVCVFTHNPTHLVVDVLGYLPGVPAAGDGESCPAEPLFPTYRMVALYGTDRSDLMGALGEQSPEAAAERLADVIEPWRAGDRPVLGTFELIATIATAAPGSDGMYRSPSSAAQIQKYLDVAREYGYYLLLDIQPGRSDFLTETQRYEGFIRQPDVGIALDPEWRMGPDEVPGEVVGQVTAAEVNQVAEYLAEIVREENLPQKLLVVHQFQDRMILDRDGLIAPPELAVNIHMDGFGTREQKLNTYSITQADSPFWNGFKLFYDEDIDMFSPADVLALDPVPDLITYQ
jgi:hypothetical protein